MSKLSHNCIKVVPNQTFLQAILKVKQFVPKMSQCYLKVVQKLSKSFSKVVQQLPHGCLYVVRKSPSCPKDVSVLSKSCLNVLPKLTQIQEEFCFDLTHYWWSVITSHFNLDIDLWVGDPWSLGILIGLVKSIVSKILCTKEWLGTFLEKKKRIKMLKAT